jgi:hypothetical protein
VQGAQATAPLPKNDWQTRPSHRPLSLNDVSYQDSCEAVSLALSGAVDLCCRRHKHLRPDVHAVVCLPDQAENRERLQVLHQFRALGGREALSER